MAVGIIIGGAFGTIVKSLVDDVLMPPIGLLIGNVDFSELFFVVKAGEAMGGPYATLAAASPIPVYGLGGLGRDDVALAESHGAHGVALLRGAWT